MRVVDAHSRHVSRVKAIVDREIREGHSHFGESATMIDEIEGWIRDAATYPFLAAENDSGDAIGFARAGRYKPREGYRWTVEISVYVEPDSQRRGVGRALYERLFPSVIGLGYRGIIAGIALPNEASVRLHESMGMRHTGTFERVGFKLGRWIDVGYWMLSCGDGPPAEISVGD